MTTEPCGNRDERLQEVLVACVETAERGQPLDRRDLLNRYPEFAAELSDFFAGRDHLEQLARPLRVLAPGTGGRSFGDYELLEEIARGGMGVVYRARHRSLGRIVALKMILTGQLASPADVQRFRTEAEAAAGLDHPHIVPIYEVGEQEGQHYFSMKLIEGGSLAHAVSRPPAADHGERARNGVRLMAQVARAVHHAHQRGILHRDLKPANVLLAAGGCQPPASTTGDLHPLLADVTPYVTDFGLAKRVQSDTTLTQSGAIVGTPSYMAPEQARGEPRLTTAVDVYALGAILYELLTGRPPFQADTPLETLRQVQQDEPERPRARNPLLDRDLETICLKCLDKEPARRYGSAEALADDLEGWLAGEPIQARRGGAWERAVKWARRKPALAALVAVSTAAAVVVPALTWQVNHARLLTAFAEAEQQRQVADTERQAREKERELRQAVEAERDAKDRALRRAEGLHLTLRSGLVRADNPGLALVLAIEGAKRHPGLLANNALLGALDACYEERTLVGHDGPVRCATFSPDGRHVVTGSDDRTARVWNVATGKETLVLRGHDRPVVRAVFSPDGRRLITVSSSRPESCATAGMGTESWQVEPTAARLWDAATGRLIAQWQDPPSERAGQGHYRFIAVSVAFSPDGRRVATTFGVWPKCPPSIHDTETGKLLVALKGHTDSVLLVAFSPDGKRIVTASTDRTARVWDADSGKLLLTLPHPLGVASASFSPDGTRLLTLGNGVTLNRNPGQDIPAGLSITREEIAGRIWDLATGKELVALRWPDGGRATNHWAAFSADGRRVLTTSTHYLDHWGPEGFPWIWDATTGKPLVREIGRDESAVSAFAAFSPETDGRRLLTLSDRSAYLRDAATGRALLVYRGHGDGINEAAFSPDGRLVVTASGDGTARVWSTDAGPESEPRHGRWRNVRVAALSPDGRSLLEVPYPSGKLTEHVARLWDALGRLRATLRGHRDFILLADFSPEGGRVITAALDNTARLWDARNGKPLAVLRGHTDRITSVAFSPDGRRVVTTAQDGTGRIWDAATGKEQVALEKKAARAHGVTLNGIEQFVEAATFSPDGRRVVGTPVGSAGWIACVWDAASGKELLAPEHPRGWNYGCEVAEFSPDGRRLLTVTRGRAILWDAVTGKEETVLMRSGEYIRFGRFSPDGRRLITAPSEYSRDRAARIWDLATSKEVITLKGHEAPVRAAAFSRDGMRVVTTSGDGTARVWESATGREFLTLKVTGAVTAAFGGEGRQVLTLGRDARLWPVDPLAVALSRKPRELTRAEQERFEIAASE